MNTIRSRYDFMKSSQQADPVTGSFYPDPLSLDYSEFQLSSLPFVKKLTETDIRSFLITIKEVYGEEIYDDMLLSLNGYSHKNFMEIGDVFYFPTATDIQRKFKTKLR